MKGVYRILALFLLLSLLTFHVSAAAGYTTVYVTDTGEKYHTYGCQYLRSSSYSISLETAVKSGYTRCSKCNSPKLTSSGSGSNSNSYTQEIDSLNKTIQNLKDESKAKDREHAAKVEELEKKAQADTITSGGLSFAAGSAISFLIAKKKYKS